MLPAKFKLEVTYAGNKGTDFQEQVNVNYIPLGTLTSAAAQANPLCAGTTNITSTACYQAYTKYPNYSSSSGLNDAVTAGKSRFDALEVSLKRSYSWMTMQANYTWSKTLAANQASGNSYFTAALPDYGTDWLYGISQQDRGHAFNIVYIFFLPKIQGANAFVRGVANNWQISGVTTIESGMQLSNASSGSNRAFNIVQGGSTAQDVTHLLGTPQMTLFPEIVCDPAKGLKPGYFANPSCFKPEPAGKLGDASIPYLPGPMYWNSDLAVSKKFKITERKELEFRASAFNFMNHGLLSFTNGDSNLQLQLNDLGQVVTGASMLYPGATVDGVTYPDVVMSCQMTTVGATINHRTYPNGIPCAGTTTFGEATHHVGSRIMELSLKFSF